MHIGKQIFIIRTIRGIKQRYVALKLGISQQAYSKLEQKEQINPDTLRKIADILECSSDYIQNFTDENLNNPLYINIPSS